MPRSVLSSLARVIAVSVLAFGAYALLPFAGRIGTPLAVLVVVVLVAGLVPLAIVRSRRILGSAHPGVEAVETLATLLHLLVIGFATVYYVIATHASGQLGGLATKVDALYYSVSILSTVGFGDITADGQLARAIVTVHMLFDLVFVAVAVRLVGWAVKRRRGDEGRGDGG